MFGCPCAVGRFASRLVLAVLAVLLGLIAPLHACGPSPSAADDLPTIQLPAVVPPPVVRVFLVAYRGQGPPEASGSESSIIAAMEGQSGSTWRLFVVVSRGEPHFAMVRKGRWISRDPAGYVDGYSLYGGYFVPNATDPEGKFIFLAYFVATLAVEMAFIEHPLPDPVRNRLMGAARIIAGGGVIYLGAGTMVGAAAAGAWGGDQIGTGMRELWTGESQDSLGSRVVKELAGEGWAGSSLSFMYDMGPTSILAIQSLSRLKNVLRSSSRNAGYRFPSRPDKAANSSRECKVLPGSSLDDIRDYATRATQNPGSSEVVLGKGSWNGTTGYDVVARQRNSTYFWMDDYQELQGTLGNDQMWNINKGFLNQQRLAGKTIYFSHNPWLADRTFAKEVLYLMDLGVKDFIQEGQPWKAVR